MDPQAQHVIVAEDDEAMRSLVVEIVRKNGFAVDEARDGGELALLLATRPRPLFVVSDVRLPVCSGLEILERMRRGGNGVPVVLMTAFCDSDTSKRAAQLGAVLLSKPFAVGELHAALREVEARAAATA